MLAFKLLYLTALLSGCGYGLARGGAPERWGAAIVLVGMVLSNVAGFRSGHLFMSTDSMLFAVDAVEAIALIVLACVANRFWPLWAAMIQLDAVFVHIVMVARATPPFSYGWALLLLGLPLPILVGAGAWRHRARMAAIAA